MSIKVGINGFGRIGRNVVRAGLDRPNIEFVAANDLTDTKTLAHLLKYDSILGPLHAEVKVDGTRSRSAGERIKIFAIKDPAEIDWSSLGVADRDRIHRASSPMPRTPPKHLRGTREESDYLSARRRTKTSRMVLGVNEEMYDPAKHNVISNASCTTNCLAPVVKVLHEKFGIEKGSMTTIHSYTNDQTRAGFSAQGSAAGARGGDQHDPHHHRRGEGDRPGHAGAERQAGRLRDARPDAERFGGGSGGGAFEERRPRKK